MYTKLLIFFALFLLPSCMIEQAAAPKVEADCFQSATAMAWLDEDGNGMRDEGERPLANITFILDPSVYSRTRSNEDGIAAIFATTPGGDCPENGQVIAAQFEGYILTTPQELPYTSADAEYAFGFQRVPTAVLIETETYTGVRFPAEKTAEFIHWMGKPGDKAWTPTEADIAALEKSLPAFLQTDAQPQADHINERLPRYARQYFGFDRAGERLIYASFLCNEMGEE